MAVYELPEVRQLSVDGWDLAPDAPVWAFLPSVWPVQDRTWINDRATRWYTELNDGIEKRTAAWDPQEYLVVDRDFNELCLRAGVGPRPKGRIWLLRVPSSAGASVDGVLDQIISGAESKGVRFQSSSALTEVTRDVIAQVWT
jgi:hypothetical protein